MKTFKSLAFKNAIVYLVIFLVGLGIMGFLLLRTSSKRIIENAENQLVHSGDLVAVQVEEYIEELITDLLFLSENPNLKAYLQRPSERNYDFLNKEFLSLLSSNGDYGQIRYLDARNGKEVVRVDRLHGKSVITPPDALQFKKDRPYFAQTVMLDSASIYFSSIDLNKEFGKISTPYTPTLRISKPIFYQEVVQGIIVINTDLTKLFDKLTKSVGSDFVLRMYNADGFYLLHEDKERVFTFEFGAQVPQVVFNKNEFSSGVQRSDDALVSNHRINLAPHDFDVFYEIRAEKSDLLASYNSWMKNSIFRILIIAILFTGLAFFILRNQFLTLQELTNSIKKYPSSRKAGALPTKRNDEIGELARSFKETVKIINDQIESIESEKLKAVSAEKDKSNFIENITHEIRNPLQSIIGLSTILEQNNPNPNQVDILNSIKLNTTNLNALVNSILDYQNILKGDIALEKQFTDVSKLVQNLVTGITFAASQKNIDIQTEIDPKLQSIEVNLDRLRVSQILNNLISNAISHTPPNGKILVEVRFALESEMDGEIHFSVLDNGIGMSKTEITKVKDRYYSKSTKNMINPNQGLGLTIVYELLSMMHSTLDIKSQEGIGSTFSFKLAESIRVKVDSKPTDKLFDQLFKNDTFLIIEDDEQILNLYKYYFRENDVTYIKSVHEISDLKGQHFDIVIMDYFVEKGKVSDFYSDLHEIIDTSTNVLMVSGRQADVRDLEQHFPTIVFMLKPITKTMLFKGIVASKTFTRFGKPFINAVKQDYDFDVSKYQKAFDLLLSEWKVYKDRLVTSIRNRDFRQLEEVVHKLNNTLRRLNLDRLEAYLLTIKSRLKDPVFDTESESVRIAEIMNVYYEYIDENIA